MKPTSNIQHDIQTNFDLYHLDLVLTCEQMSILRTMMKFASQDAFFNREERAVPNQILEQIDALLLR